MSQHTQAQYEATKASTVHGGDLSGYELVPTKDWSKIKPRSYIRYMRNDGVTTVGGYVKSVWVNDNEVKIDLSNKASNWSIVSSNVQKIWKRVTEADCKSKDIEDIKKELSMCKNAIKKLDSELTRLNNDLIRVIALVKELRDSKK